MQFIKGIKDENDNILLSKIDSSLFEVKKKSDNLTPLDASSERMRICFLDLETTGTDKKEDKIIEIALKCIELNKSDGSDMNVIDAYESFQDPNMSIPEDATKVNGITDDMVKGQSIDWNVVESIFNTSQLIVAHNASFDRAFMDQSLEVSKHKIWACSINDINWDARGFISFKQETLCINHGFYYDSHRAMNDIDALIHLLIHPSYADNKPVAELIKNAKQNLCRIDALFSKYEYKDILRKNGYRWHDPNNGKKDEKCWRKFIHPDDKDSEYLWITKNVYNNQFQGRIVEITLKDKYKDD